MTSVSLFLGRAPVLSYTSKVIEERFNQLKSTANGYLLFELLGVDRLKSEDILTLYNLAKNENSPHLKLFTFEVRDYLLRRISLEPCAINYPEELKKDISRLDQNNGAFYSLDQLARGRILDTRESGKLDQPRSLQVTLEYEKAMIGGVGSVVKSLSYQMKQKGIDGRVVTPFYDVYKKDIAQDHLKFVGFITHELEGRTFKSSIYKTKSQGGQVPHYLVQCDPARCHIFDIGTSTEVYTAVNFDYNCEARSLYLASVVAVMGSTYRGRKKQKQFDVVSFHTWTTSLAAHLMKDSLGPLRKNAGLPKVHTMQHYHHGSLDLADERSGAWLYKKFRDSGVLYGDFFLYTDGVGFVSPVLPEEAQKAETGYGLHRMAKHVAKYDRMAFLPNGIVWNDHGLSSEKAHGTYAVPETAINYVAAKGVIKTDLCHAGLIPDSDRPLFLYFGRYTPEKGLSLLEAMVKAAIDGGGQCVIMGWGSGNDVPQEILNLQKLPQEYQKYLKIYTKSEDQTATFLDSKASKGSLIRAAADAHFLPSKAEGYAMVVMESLARGVLLVSSDGGGLKVQCIDQAERDNFNGFKFTNAGDATLNAVQATKRAVEYFNRTNLEDRNDMVKRLIQDSKKFDWLGENGALDKIQAFYKQIMKPRIEDEIAEREGLIQDYFKKLNN